MMTAAGMTAEAFRNWRKGLGWKQKDAADRLGLKKRVIQYYEKGARDGKDVEVPKAVELACLALALGFEGYDGGSVVPIAPVKAIADTSLEPSVPADPAFDLAAAAVAPVAPETSDHDADDAQVPEAKVKARRSRKKG